VTNDPADRPPIEITRDLPDVVLRIARSDARGVPLVGRKAEMDALRQAGNHEPSAGRIFEGHVNAAQLVARCGTDEQRERLERDLAGGHVFGVWNTQDTDGVRLEDAGDVFVLRGAKTWASGAGTITRALITALPPNGLLQMCLVPMDRVPATIDRSAWQPMGMERSDSFRVVFDGVKLSSDDLIGKPQDYEAQPWFSGGALRFLAVHTGILERLEAEATTYLVERNRHSDSLQQMRAAQVRVANRTSRQWLDAGVESWMRFDAEPSQTNANDVLEVVDMARVAIERAALEVSELIMRSVGARGLLEPIPLGRLIRDLQMYLRQPAPDAALLRVGAAAFNTAIAARNSSIASPTGTSG
jgi:alkylation response protein AidB-like acyl-CoA dehydrogenase